MEQTEKTDGLRHIAVELIQFSLPLILSGVLQQLYNWVDAFVVGNVEGELALAAVGATGTVVNFYVTAITGFTLGLAILFAQKFGSRETEAIPKILKTFAVLLGAVFLALAAVGFCLTEPFLRLLNTTPDTIGLAGDYLRIILIGVPFLAVYNVYAAALRGTGDSRAPFLAVLLSSAVNVVLDIVLVAVLRWSVAGAAVATVLSQAAMTVFLIAYSIKKYPLLRFSRADGLLDRAMLVQGVRLGVPPMIQSSVSACGSLILQNFMNGFGTRTVAAITTAYRIDTIVLLPIINLGSGISTIVAQNYGAGRMARTRKVLVAGTLLMTVTALLLAGFVIPMGGRLIALFGVGPEAVAIGERFFHGIAGFYLVFGLATAVRGYLEGLGDVLYSSVAGILSLAVRIAGSYTLVGFFGDRIIAYAEAIAWGVLLALYLGRVLWRRTKKAI